MFIILGKGKLQQLLILPVCGLESHKENTAQPVLYTLRLCPGNKPYFLVKLLELPWKIKTMYFVLFCFNINVLTERPVIFRSGGAHLFL